MNSKEAKFILSAYRPNGHDARDEHFRKALDQMEGDPELRQWFAAEREFDAAVSEGLSRVRPPADLKLHILAGARASRAGAWSWRPLVAIAALVILCAAVAVVALRPDRETPAPRLAAWQQKAIDFLDHDPHLDKESPDSQVLIEYLKTANAPTLDSLPTTLDELKAAGCKQLEVDGQRISVVCFHGKDGELVHLVITDRTADRLASNVAGPVFARHDGWAMATWAEGDRSVMLLRQGDLEAVKRILGSA